MSPTLAIGGTLEPGAADALTARGFTRVIDLRLPEEGTPAEAAALAGHGLAYVNFPTDGSAPSRERLAAFTALIDAAPGQPLKAAYETAAEHDALVLAEKFIDGTEFTVGILGDTSLPLIRLEPAKDKAFYDFDAKYIRNDTQYHCPAGLPEADEQALRRLALEAFRLVGCSGWGRVDVMRDSLGNPYLLEVNTSPGHDRPQLGADGRSRRRAGF